MIALIKAYYFNKEPKEDLVIPQVHNLKKNQGLIFLFKRKKYLYIK